MSKLPVPDHVRAEHARLTTAAATAANDAHGLAVLVRQDGPHASAHQLTGVAYAYAQAASYADAAERLTARWGF